MRRAWQEEKRKVWQKGKQKVWREAEGRLYTLIELALDGVLSRAEAAARANLSEQEFVKKAEEYSTGPSQPFPQ